MARSCVAAQFVRGRTLEKERHLLITEALRQWIVQAGRWKYHKRRVVKVPQQRERRGCCGDLGQLDSSEHESSI